MMDIQSDIAPYQAPLLQKLPLELRRQIYEYVVTDDGHATVIKVSARNDPSPRFRLYPHDPEKLSQNYGLNQLRFVCRQLYWETSGFGLRRNVLHFNTTTDPIRGTESCVLFLGICSRPHLASISKIRILGLGRPHLTHQRIPSSWGSSSGTRRWYFGLFDLEAVPKLAEYCLSYPNLSVDIILPDMRVGYDFSKFYMTISVLVLALRKQRLEYLPAPDDVHLPVRVMSRVWEGYGVEAKPLPENLRFYSNYEIGEDDAQRYRNEPWWNDFKTQFQIWQKQGI